MSRRKYLGSVNSRGQITIPAEIRTRLGIQSHGHVAIEIEGESVRITPVRSCLLVHYQKAGSLRQTADWRHMIEIAAEGHADQVVQEGLG